MQELQILQKIKFLKYTKMSDAENSVLFTGKCDSRGRHTAISPSIQTFLREIKKRRIRFQQKSIGHEIPRIVEKELMSSLTLLFFISYLILIFINYI